MEPGETRQLQVELANQGNEAMDVRTYAADAFTLVNGGFGAEERDGVPTGTTTWLDYPAEVLSLPAGEATVRPLEVSVPEGTEPGEYIAGIVLENDVPVEGTGGVALDQIVRQALPVVVQVPGEDEPAFEFGEAGHRFAAGSSVVGVGIANTGNTRLVPEGALIVRDEDGDVVQEAPVAMHSFFAGTETQVEALLDDALEPGDYTVDVSMTDPESGETATVEELPFTVEGKPANEIVSKDQPDAARDSNNALVISLVIAVVILVLLVLFLLIRNHRRQKD